ncbi:MAG: DUF1802 family protein [Symploca sp. SIO1B1]|nr:DUF1802 family protein [Symploca sp. SIO1C2]NER92905.1 DUF1802 family protein [Symploca sp. SIO1B1]
MESATTHALKEWAIAVDALERGKTIMLLRKGGIREKEKRFQVTYNQVLLYPTYEHQQPHLLKAEYASEVEPVTSGWHPETVRIGSWAEITDILAVSDEAGVEALLPYHIWNEQFARERFQWKPSQPLYILLLRTYRLSQPLMIPYRQEYSGCRSWINLAEAIALENLIPVIDEIHYTKQVAQIRQLVKSA